MRLKSIEADPEQPFKHCKLDRFRYADALSSVVATYTDGFVLALNSPWGTGKTTFLKMWKALLEQRGFRTIYFNAWENDFDTTPQVALMAELKGLTSKKNDHKFKSLVKKASVLSANMLPALVKAVAAKYLDSEVLKDALENATKGATDILGDEITDYVQKKKGLLEFKDELKDYVKQHADGKPIVLMIDELDRCNPNYGVNLLENVKHFFNVPGIVFILSIDKDQLGNAICGYYGSDNIDAKEYLRRFIDIEFSLPKPEQGLYCRFLYESLGFSTFLRSKKRLQHNELKYDEEEFVGFACELFDTSNLTLRQQEKILTHARVAIDTFEINNYLFPSLYVFLIFVKQFHNTFYQNLLNRKDSAQSILNQLAGILPKIIINEDDVRKYVLLEASLIRLYLNYKNERNHRRYHEVISEDEKTLLVKPAMDKSKDYIDFLHVFTSLRSNNRGDVKLSHLLDKVDLMNQLITPV